MQATPNRRWFAAFGTAAALAGLAACGGGGAPSKPREHGPFSISLASGTIPVDSILKPVPDSLVFLVRDARGDPARGITVRLHQIVTAVDEPGRAPNLYLTTGIPNLPDGPLSINLITDLNGTVFIRAFRGWISGSGELIAGFAEPGQTATVRVPYTILHGPPSSFDVQPHDTSMYAGTSFPLRPTIRDAGGNLIREPPLYLTHSPAVTITPDGVVTADATGRVEISITSGNAAITRWLSVVPRLRIACIGSAGLEELDTDGANQRALLAPAKVNGAAGFHFAPNGQYLVAAVPNSEPPLAHSPSIAMYVRDPAGGFAKLSAPGMISQGHLWPRYDAVGTWIYYAQATHENGSSQIWRVRTDGTLAEELTDYLGTYPSDINPAPSPDGNTVAFATDRRDPSSGQDFFEIALLELATGVMTITPHRGFLPRWSPDGSHIAFLWENEVHVADAAGQNSQPLTVNGVIQGSLDWSPDGNWLLSAKNGYATLIDAATGEVLPLRVASDCGISAFVP